MKRYRLENVRPNALVKPPTRLFVEIARSSFGRIETSLRDWSIESKIHLQIHAYKIGNDNRRKVEEIRGLERSFVKLSPSRVTNGTILEK